MKLKNLLKEYPTYDLATRILKDEINCLEQYAPKVKRLQRAKKLLSRKLYRKALVEKILESLPAEEGEILRFRFIEGLPAEQVAVKTFRSESTVYNIQKKALAKAQGVMQSERAKQSGVGEGFEGQKVKYPC